MLLNIATVYNYILFCFPFWNKYLRRIQVIAKEPSISLNEMNL